MTIETHANMVQRLKSKDYEGIAERKTATLAIMDMDHAITGIFTEGGEMADALKRHFYYGTELDLVNLQEECGDIVWYLQLLVKALGTTLEEVMDTNEAKLKARYGDKFTEESAVNRNLEAERQILEEGEEGWEVNTGEMPVAKGTLIDIIHRDGEHFYSQQSGSDFCQDWEIIDNPGDIMKWRQAQ